MLEIKLDDSELFNDKTQEFILIKGRTIQLEHSLISISKWESKWKKPFLSENQKTNDEVLDYIQCMCLKGELTQYELQTLKQSVINEIQRYIEDPSTATWFNDMGKTNSEGNKENVKNTNTHERRKKEVITSEVVYSWMIALTIPFECQKWHLNRLLTLIRVCNIKNNPQKNNKMNKRDVLKTNAELNAARKKQLGTSG